jgi:hypothetical protein
VRILALKGRDSRHSQLLGRTDHAEYAEECVTVVELFGIGGFRRERNHLMMGRRQVRDMTTAREF